MDMNKEWMMAPRLSNEYLKGVEDFLEFLRANRQKLGGDDWYCCPCVKCRNIVGGKKTLRDIREHLICDGIDTSYTRWIHHGEIQSTSTVNIGTINNNEDAFPRMVDMVNDVFARIPNEDGVEHHMGGSAPTGMDETNHEEDVNAQDNSPEGIQYKKLMEDAMQPLYPSCRIDDTKLSVTVELLSMKAKHKWSNKSFNGLLQLFKRVLPEHNVLPDNTYNAKKIVDSLRMEEKIIHACRNDCILYWRENEERDNCPTCGLSRWKPVNPAKPRAVRLPWKKLRYFPITPRLQRMYSVPWIAESMTWHANASLVPNDSIMRHPVDSSCWKQVDRKNPHFASEARNVRLGLATDGFNPFGIKNNAYSVWPVMVVPYNLPPSLCMRKEFTMLTLLIPGKKGPGHDIDIYLQPLIAELNELWSIGTITYDSYNKNRFTMKAILLWVIHDFPAYGHLSGCRTAGRYACPVCGEETDSLWLKHGKKCTYMEHRRFLPNSRHPFRSQKSQFNGKEEHRKPPRRLSGSELLSKMENIQTNFGKSKKRKRPADELNSTPWTKRSIFFDLPYWKDLPIRHNLDVMHIEKNVTEILIGTIMNTKDKTKDGLQARQDLKEMKIKKKLWPVEKNGKLTYPNASYTLSRLEKELICKTLYQLKVPIGYSGNWRHNVNLDDLELKNLKSHDYHILMQQLLPVMLMYAFESQKPLRAAIRHLSIFFNVLCSKVINREELMKMKDSIVETLCVFEKYFPPSFFVSMIHLVVHLADEAKICGPVRYRWSKLKSPHTTGRKGQARVAAELKAKNPDQPLTRTDLFLATHKRKDGSASSPHVDDVITACESNSSVAQGDLDHDAVTKVFGRDSRGRVRGLGTVSKTAIKHSAPYKRALEKEHECNTHLQTKVKRLKEGQMGIQREMEELKQALTQGGTQVRPSTYYGSSSQAQDDSSCQLACANQPNINTRQGPCRLLHYVRKEITVALGRVLGLSIEEEGCYRIVVDEILKSDVELLGGEKTFGDLTMGDIISWPTYRTIFG